MELLLKVNRLRPTVSRGSGEYTYSLKTLLWLLNKDRTAIPGWCRGNKICKPASQPNLMVEKIGRIENEAGQDYGSRYSR